MAGRGGRTVRPVRFYKILYLDKGPIRRMVKAVLNLTPICQIAHALLSGALGRPRAKRAVRCGRNSLSGSRTCRWRRYAMLTSSRCPDKSAEQLIVLVRSRR